MNKLLGLFVICLTLSLLPLQAAQENELDHLRNILGQKDIDLKVKDWAIRNLKKYPAPVSGPILLEQLERETPLKLLPVVAYIVGELKYLEAVPQLVRVLNTNLADYGFKSLQECSDHLETLKQKRRNLYEEKGQLKKLAQLRRKHRLLQTQMQSLKKQIDKLTAEGRQPSETYKDYKKRLQALQTQYQNLEKQVADLDKQIKKIESDTQDVRDKLAETEEAIRQNRADMTKSYKQQVNVDLVYLRSIEALGKMRTIDEAAINRLYTLVFRNSIPISFMAIDALKLINDSQVVNRLAQEKLSDPTHHDFKRASLALTELHSPYTDLKDRTGSEWIAKSVLELLTQELNNQNKNNETTMKMLQIIKHLQRPGVMVDDPKAELAWSIEFISLVDSIIKPETYFEYRLLVRFIKDDIITRAQNRTFQDVLQPASSTKPLTPK